MNRPCQETLFPWHTRSPMRDGQFKLLVCDDFGDLVPITPAQLVVSEGTELRNLFPTT